MPQFQKDRTFEYAKAVDGCSQMLWGFFKKLVIADKCAMVVNTNWSDYQQLPAVTLVILAVLFSFQIYCDFSGYSDIAIGCARLFGFDLKQNFNLPYFSRCIPEFWRRWHISLTTWFRDYIYFPLGGSRCSKAKIIRNVFIVWAVSGLWHGANWTFVCWGLFHATLLAIYNILGINTKYKDVVTLNVKSILQMTLTFVLAVIGWVIFRAESMSQVCDYFSCIFHNKLIDMSLIKGKLALILCCLLVVTEFLQRTKVHALQFPDNKLFDKRFVRWGVENHINDIEILFLGNSHIEEAVKPELVGKNAFNMAISGRGVVYDVEIAKRYIPQMQNLKAVFMPLDYPKFNLGRGQKNANEKRTAERDWNRIYKCMYYKYMGIRVDEFYYWSEIYNSSLDYMMRFVKTEEQKRECDSLGYIALDVTKRNANWAYRNMPPVIDVNKPVDTEKFNELKSWYTTLAELTKNRNAQLILLGTPMYETYQKDLNPKVLEEILSFVETLKKDFPNVEYYDYTFDKDFLPDDFNDASHLTDSGADKFSRKLKEVMKN